MAEWPLSGLGARIATSLASHFNTTLKLLWINGSGVLDVSDFTEGPTETSAWWRQNSSGATDFLTDAEALTQLFGDASAPAAVTAEVTAASDTGAGKVELAITSEVDTGTDAARAVTPDALAGSYAGTAVMVFRVFGVGVNATTGEAKARRAIPSVLNGMNLVTAEAYIPGTPGTTSGTMTLTVERERAGAPVDMLSSALSFATSATAATGGAINASNDDVATGDFIDINCDGVHGTPAVGEVVVYLSFRKP